MKLSIIVPIYKVEPYLHRCVDSILNQTFTDFECILVDDGSPDNCPAICDEYAEKDSRIHVIHQANGGLAAARNAGIDWVFANSDSECLTFIDSDDWVHPIYLEALYQAIQETGVAVSVCNFERTEGDEPTVDETKIFPELWNTEEFYRNRHVTATIACGKLYRKECFRKIRYPVGRIHEDESVTYRILLNYEKTAVITQPLYAYFQNPTGIMHNRKLEDVVLYFSIVEERIEYFRKRGSKDLYLWQVHTYIRYLASHIIGNSGPELNENEVDQLKKVLSRKLRQKWVRREYPFVEKKMWVYGMVYPIRVRIKRIVNKIRRIFGSLLK